MVNWKEISEFNNPEKSPGFLLWQVSTIWRREIEKGLKTLGLTHPQFVLLASVGWLTKEQSCLSQVELARQCRLDITMTSQILRFLEKKELIKRVQKKGDERSKFPTLTTKGTQLIEKAIPLVESIDKAFFSPLGEKQKDYLYILQKLCSVRHLS